MAAAVLNTVSSIRLSNVKTNPLRVPSLLAPPSVSFSRKLSLFVKVSIFNLKIQFLALFLLQFVEMLVCVFVCLLGFVFY